MTQRTGDDFLTPERVRAVYDECCRPEVPAARKGLSANRAEVTAWILRHTFSVRALRRRREDVVRMLLCLPEGFREDVGRGGSVVHATMRADGVQWTQDMSDVEKFVSLGIASGLMEFCSTRDRWHRLPGGMPYVRVLITRFGVSVN